MQLNTKLDFAKVDRDKENEVTVLATITAPAAKKGVERKPLNIVAVIDVSGSMSGQKLEHVKTSCDVMIDNMTEKDSIAVVEFTSESRVVMPLTKLMGGKKQDVKNAIHAMHAQASTNLSGGISDGFSCLKDTDTSSATSAVLVFTDGQANSGIRDGSGLTVFLAGLRETTPNVRASFFGYGADHDGDLLATLAKVGGGNYHFVNDPEKIAAAFGDEFGSLLTVVGQSLKLEVTPNNGVTILEVLDDVAVEEKTGGKVLISLDDILAEDKKHCLIKVKLPAATKAVAARPVTVCDLALSWVDPEGKSQSVTAKARVLYTKAAEADKVPDVEVDAQINRIKVANASKAAKEKAEAGDFVGARGIMAFCVDNLRGSASHDDAFVTNLVDDALKLGESLENRVQYLSAGGAANMANYTSSLNRQSYTGEWGASKSKRNAVRSATAASFSQAAGDPGSAQNVKAPVVPEEKKEPEKKSLTKSRSARSW